MLKFWFFAIFAATAASAAIVEYVPPPLSMAKAPATACGENAGWIEVKPTVFQCTLKNGHVTGVLIKTRVPQ